MYKDQSAAECTPHADICSRTGPFISTVGGIVYRNVYNRIKKRRENLGLSYTYVASQINQSQASYWDMEMDKTEVFSVTPLSSIKALCKLFSVSFFDLFGLRCDFCQKGKPFDQDYLLPRNELIKKRREALGLSREELGDRVGFYEIAIISMEEDPDYLETWVLENIIHLGKELKIPLQILLGEKCDICNH